MSSLITTFGIDWHLLALQTANFIVLAVLLTWLLYKPVMKIVKEREQVINKGVADAEAAGEQLAAAGAEATKTVRKAELDAEEIVKGARAEAMSEKTQIVKDAEARAAQVEKDAAARAAEDAARMKRESEKEIARLAILAAEKVLTEKA